MKKLLLIVVFVLASVTQYDCNNGGGLLDPAFQQYAENACERVDFERAPNY